MRIYLRRRIFRKQLCRQLDNVEKENFFPITYAMTTMGKFNNDLPSRLIVDRDSQHREIVISQESIESMVDEVNDFGMVKFHFFNMVGGMIANKSIDR